MGWAHLEAAVEVVSGEELVDDGAQGVLLCHTVQGEDVETPQVEALGEDGGTWRDSEMPRDAQRCPGWQVMLRDAQRCPEMLRDAQDGR